VHLREVVLFSTTLVAIVNPISSAVLFASMAGRFTAPIQTRMANQSAFAILVILLGCAWAGRFVLQILGINVPMLQAAGGLILLQYCMRLVTV
jgi:multiple antibiotic resistance protein